jgi:FtsH-binding integral membrane protein
VSKDDRPRPGDPIKPKKPAKVQFTSTVLQLEAFVVLFAALALYGLRDSSYERGPFAIASPTALWIVAGVLFVTLIVLSRMVARPGGYVAGSVAQVPVLAMGLLLPMMFLVAGIFVLMWVVSLRLGARVDRERAEYDASHPETAPNLDT